MSQVAARNWASRFTVMKRINKVTYVTLFGVEKASEQVLQFSEQAQSILENLSNKNKFLDGI